MGLLVSPIELTPQEVFILYLTGFGKWFPFGEDGLMVCLHTYAGRQIRRGLYLEDEKLKLDGMEDWEKFWRPLEAALNKELECRSRRVRSALAVNRPF